MKIVYSISVQLPKSHSAKELLMLEWLWVPVFRDLIPAEILSSTFQKIPTG